jgi:hypothetical protein
VFYWSPNCVRAARAALSPRSVSTLIIDDSEMAGSMVDAVRRSLYEGDGRWAAPDRNWVGLYWPFALLLAFPWRNV